MKDSKNLHPLQYALVIVGILAIATIKLHLAFFQHGLTGTLLLAIVAGAALLGDYIAGLLALVLGTIALNFLISPAGLNFGQTAVFQALEFLLASTIICMLAWRERSLKRDNSALVANANELKAILRSLQKESKGNSKEVAKLKEINKDLDELVKQFLEDDRYWSARWGASSPQDL